MLCKHLRKTLDPAGRRYGPGRRRSGKVSLGKNIGINTLKDELGWPYKEGEEGMEKSHSRKKNHVCEGWEKVKNHRIFR